MQLGERVSELLTENETLMIKIIEIKGVNINIGKKINGTIEEIKIGIF